MLINYESMFESEEKIKARTAKAHRARSAQKNADEIVQLCGKKAMGWGIVAGGWKSLESLPNCWVQPSTDVHMSSLRRHCVCFNQR